MVAKFILPVLALVGSALAQCSGGITLHSNSDAETISGCSTYSGTITIDPSVQGTLQLDGITIIDGDLVCSNATGLNGISGSQLQTITGTFNLQGLTVLSTLQFNYLATVNKINWIGLPALQGLNFATGISEANQVYISNTQLNDLAGIELTAVGSMDINNNPYLDTVNVNSLTNITNVLSFSANGQNLDISFPNLLGAGNMTFRNISSLSIPSLAQVGGSIGLYSDYFSNFSAPNLTSIGQALAVVDCPQLTDLSFPKLQIIGGGFILANNSDLTSVADFPSLQTIAGAINFVGAFQYVSFPSIHDVRGGSTVLTTSTNASFCNIFNNASSRGIIKGVNKCSTGAATAAGNSSSGSGSSSSNHNAASVLGLDYTMTATALFGVVAAMFFL